MINGNIKVIRNGTGLNNGYGIYNNANGIINMSGGKITNESSKGDRSAGIYNNNNGTINMSGGIIESLALGNYVSYANGIYNATNGIINMTGGNVILISNGASKYASYGIFNSKNGTITLGVKGNGIASNNEPNISTTYNGTLTSYSIYNQFGTFNFYDGIIQSNGSCIYGGITEIEENHEIVENSQDGYEKIYLVEQNANNYILENVITGKQYSSFIEAINEITKDANELKIIKDFTLSTPLIIPDDKNIILDLNGRTITNKYFLITNYGNFEIIDNGENGNIINEETVIINLVQGTINISGGYISSNTNTGISSYAYGIYNDMSGTINISGGYINCNSISSGSYSYAYGIYNADNGIINVNGGKFINEDSRTDVSYGVYNADNGIINITEGNINRNDYGIYNSTGTVNITGGNISSEEYGIYNSTGTVNITGGNISSNEYGIYNNSTGTICIESGIINCNNDEYSDVYGIYNRTTGIIIIGIKGDGIISTDEPNIIATYAGMSTSDEGYGIYNPNGTLNFYDGRIEGSTKASYDDSGATDIEETQIPQFSKDNKIYAYGIDATDVARIGDKTYLNLQDAINEATDTDVIELLRGIQYTNQDVTLIVPSDKNVTIDLQNNPIVSAIEDAVFTIEGNLKIIDSIGEENGKISSSYQNTIYVKKGGNLYINGGTITNNKSGNNVITNEGTTSITGGTVSLSNSSGYVINNLTTGIVNISSGTISNSISDSIGSNYIYAIYNSGNGEINIKGGTIDVITDEYRIYAYGIYNNSSGTVNMTNGIINISSRRLSCGIYNSSNGIINMIGGTLNSNEGEDSYGIYSTSGTVNIGKSDITINTENPNILGTTNGIYTSEDCILNIYDGIIKGEETAISGDITSLEEQSEIVIGEETISNRTYETIFLVKVDSPIASVDSTQYYSLKEALDNINGAETIQILRTGTVGQPINIPSDKNVNIDLNGNTLNMYTQFENNGTLNITDLSSSGSGILTGYKDRLINNNGNLTLSGGTISGITYGIYNNSNGTTKITGGTLSDNKYAIYNSSSNGIVNVTNGTITGNTYGVFNYNGTTNVSTGNEYGVYNSSGTTNVTNGIINANTYGIYNNSGTTNISNLTITGNTTEVVNGGTGTTNILSGNIISNTIAVTNTLSGRVNIGSQDLAVDKENPVIQGEQYGIANTGTGSIAFYDGIVKGKEGSIQGYYLYTETGYIAQTNVVDGYYCDTLALSGTVTTVAKIGDIEYTNLQSAINACTSDTPTTITLVNSINSTQMFTIEEGQNVIIDLNGSTIATGTLEKLIENAGTLTIIDTNDRQTGKISNTSGIAINNTGTLNLGQDDGTVSTTCPEVVGKSTGIVNTGTFNFYDGIIKGAEALSGNVTARPDGYVINSSTDEATGMKQLTLGR